MTTAVTRVVALALVMLATMTAFADAQDTRRAARIGYLAEGTADVEKVWLTAFQNGLRALGRGDDTVTYELRFAEGRSERLPQLAAELARLKPDVIFATSTPAAVAAKKVVGTIPLVALSADPVGVGLVASLARPGGTVTGLSDFHAGVVVKRLEILKDVAPGASRFAVLVNPTNPTNRLQWDDVRTSAPALRLTVVPLEVKAADDIDRAFAALAKDRVGGLVVLGDRLFTTNQRRIAELATQHRLPAIYAQRSLVQVGGLMSYGTNFEDLQRRAASYVDKILKGTKPADLPVEQSAQLELVINLKTAAAMGLTIPPSLRLRADRVIE